MEELATANVDPAPSSDMVICFETAIGHRHVYLAEYVLSPMGREALSFPYVGVEKHRLQSVELWNVNGCP